VPSQSPSARIEDRTGPAPPGPTEPSEEPDLHVAGACTPVDVRAFAFRLAAFAGRRPERRQEQAGWTFTCCPVCA